LLELSCRVCSGFNGINDVHVLSRRILSRKHHPIELHELFFGLLFNLDGSNYDLYFSLRSGYVFRSRSKRVLKLSRGILSNQYLPIELQKLFCGILLCDDRIECGFWSVLCGNLLCRRCECMFELYRWLLF